MSLVNNLGDGDTHTDTDRQTHTHTHKEYPGEINFKKTGTCQNLPSLLISYKWKNNNTLKYIPIIVIDTSSKRPL